MQWEKEPVRSPKEQPVRRGKELEHCPEEQPVPQRKELALA